MKSLKPNWSRLNDTIESCQKCKRLVKHCRTVAREKRRAYADETYWGKPVGNFGKRRSQLLIVGLAPGAHGANRTGRMFTGDRSGEWLFRALHRAGFANRAESRTRNDRLRLKNCAITNICHCAPPDNKPTAFELKNCRPFLNDTIALTDPIVFLALGGLAWKAIVQFAREENWLNKRVAQPKFSHGAAVKLETKGNSGTLKSPRNSESRRWLVGSYHPSQQNTFTGRLTEKMFDQVFEQVNQLIQSESKT